MSNPQEINGRFFNFGHEIMMGSNEMVLQVVPVWRWLERTVSL